VSKVDLEIYIYSRAGSESLVLTQRTVNQLSDLLTNAGVNITFGPMLKHGSRTSSLLVTTDDEGLLTLSEYLSQSMNWLTQHRSQNG
jgi:hypothetical protein